jgi:hypothetical protein
MLTLTCDELILIKSDPVGRLFLSRSEIIQN